MRWLHDRRVLQPLELLAIGKLLLFGLLLVGRPDKTRSEGS